MKVWEKAKNTHIKRLKEECKKKIAEVESNWIDFKNTGYCTWICCDDCPLLGKRCVDMTVEEKREKMNEVLAV